MGDRLLIGTAPQGILPGVVEIVDGTLGIASAREMHRQLGGHLPCLRPIAHLLALADAAMQLRPPRRRQPGVCYLLVERMRKPVASCYCPVRPALLSVRLQPLPPSGQVGAPLLHLD